MDIRASAASMSPAAKDADWIFPWIPEKCSSASILQFWEKRRNIKKKKINHLIHISVCLCVYTSLKKMLLLKFTCDKKQMTQWYSGLLFSTVAFHPISLGDKSTNCTAYTNSHTTLIGPSWPAQCGLGLRACSLLAHAHTHPTLAGLLNNHPCRSLNYDLHM